MTERRSGRQSVSVEIAGERHVLKSGASPEYTQNVAAHLDETIRSLGLGNTLDPHRAAILAALTITDELFRTRAELAELRAELAHRSTRLAELLDQAAKNASDADTPAKNG
ncbi:MAG: cell division protein ZapA [Gemmatimonadota bacterium]